MRLSLSFLLCGLVVYVFSLWEMLLQKTHVLDDSRTNPFLFLENLSLSDLKSIHLHRLVIDWPRMGKKLLDEALVRCTKGLAHHFISFSKFVVKEAGRGSAESKMYQRLARSLHSVWLPRPLIFKYASFEYPLAYC